MPSRRISAPTFPGKPNDRRAEHAGRRRHPRDDLSPVGRAEGRHHDRLRAFERAVRAALRHDGREIRSARDELARQPQCQSGICVLWHTSPIKTWQDVFEKEFSVGGTGAGSPMETIPSMLNKFFGTKIKIVSGYKGGNEIYLAMERGEVDGRCGGLMSSINSTRPDWFPQKKVTVPIVIGVRAQSAIPRRAGDRRIRQGRSEPAGAAPAAGAAGHGSAVPGAARRAGRAGRGLARGLSARRSTIPASSPMPRAWGLKSTRSSGEKLQKCSMTSTRCRRTS